jgi:hypothetical protein
VVTFNKNFGLVDIYRGGWRRIQQYAERERKPYC